MKDKLNTGFYNVFNDVPTHYFSCGGRFEILGNHTDHNHGYCLAATCDLAIYSALTPRNDLTVRLHSKGHPSFEIDLSTLDIINEEKNTSQALIRGIGKYLTDLGYKIGGFDIYMESDIFPGAGVSSSAAFELLIANIFNVIFNNGCIDKMILCKAGQFAENKYFQKSSGLLDQIGVCYGGVSFIDFSDIENPKVSSVNIDFKDLHYVIVNTGGSHAQLSDLYSEIPTDMKLAAASAGVSFLNDTTLDEIDITKINQRQYDRAIHFYGECERVKKAYDAIIRKDEDTFLKMVNESRLSSTNYLKNMMAFNIYENSPLEACDIALKAMNNTGAVKINGGGFAGSIICFVKDEYLSKFISVMSNKYGDNNVKEVEVRPFGPILF